MSAGSVFVKVLLVVLNLSIVGIVAMSAYAVATENIEVDMDPDALQFDMNEESISIEFPFSLRFGGYWDIKDFYYSFHILDNNNDVLVEDGQGPMLLRKGVTNNLLIQADINTSQLLGLVDEDLILNGINLTLGVEMGATYMADLFQFSFSLDLLIPVEPIFTEFGVDESSFQYNDTNDTLSFQVNHTASEMFQDFEFPLAVQLANDTTSMGWGAANVQFSQPYTEFWIEVNQTALQDAIASGDMVFLRFGLPVSEEEFGPSFTIDLFQLNGHQVSNSTYDSITETLSIEFQLDTFSIFGGTVNVNATINDGGADKNAENSIDLQLNSIGTGYLEFNIEDIEYPSFGPNYVLMANLQMFGFTWELIDNGSTA
ncbi:MAG: hypothetical protein WCY65_00230 [Candidatus Methanomethylophilaceae archaeon]